MAMMFEPDLFKVLMPPAPPATTQAFWVAVPVTITAPGIPAQEPAIIKMDPILKRAWIEALRFGGYEQCRGALRMGPRTFCAIGLLQHIVANMASAVQLIGKDYTNTAIRMNDSGMSFLEIASWAERTL
jgi:hypothetical protein